MHCSYSMYVMHANRKKEGRESEGEHSEKERRGTVHADRAKAKEQKKRWKCRLGMPPELHRSACMNSRVAGMR